MKSSVSVLTFDGVKKIEFVWFGDNNLDEIDDGGEWGDGGSRGIAILSCCLYGVMIIMLFIQIL
jgi:hypothetical protein